MYLENVRDKKFLIIIENVIEIKRKKTAKKLASIVIVEGSRGYNVLMYG